DRRALCAGLAAERLRGRQFHLPPGGFSVGRWLRGGPRHLVRGLGSVCQAGPCRLPGGRAAQASVLLPAPRRGVLARHQRLPPPAPRAAPVPGRRPPPPGRADRCLDGRRRAPASPGTFEGRAAFPPLPRGRPRPPLAHPRPGGSPSDVVSPIALPPL